MRRSGPLNAVKLARIFVSRFMMSRGSRIRTNHGKTVGKTKDQTEKPCQVDPDSGRRKFEWCIALNDDVLGRPIRDADELLSYLCE